MNYHQSSVTKSWKWVGMVSIILGFVFAAGGMHVFGSARRTLVEYATNVLVTCSGLASPARQRCYDEAIPRLMNRISLRDAFVVTQLIQEKDDSYWFCHALAHNISATAYSRSPHSWHEILASCPVGMCSNGCIHGVLQRKFRSDVLTSAQLTDLIGDLENLCEPRKNWKPTPLEQASCYHELGHLSVYLTGADIQGSAHLCDRIAVKTDGRSFLQTCYEGLFMQVFEPREPEDFALVYPLIPQKDAITSCEQYLSGPQKGACWKRGWKGRETIFCNTLSGEIRDACIREAWVVDDEQIETPQGMMRYCSYTSDQDEQRKCYNKLYYSLMAKYEFDERPLLAICMALPQRLKPQCFSNAASRLVETDTRLIGRAVNICETANAFGVSEACFTELVYFIQVSSQRVSVARKHLCDALPNERRDTCYTGAASTARLSP